ncbi:hypothetical protein [Nostoc sp.]|uniref:hypothetical protein n=1 Tax=Nostoc sp. TaxID=1180 RepID=UPI002FF56048
MPKRAIALSTFSKAIACYGRVSDIYDGLFGVALCTFIPKSDHLAENLKNTA